MAEGGQANEQGPQQAGRAALDVRRVRDQRRQLLRIARQQRKPVTRMHVTSPQRHPFTGGYAWQGTHLSIMLVGEINYIRRVGSPQAEAIVKSEN